MSLLLSTWSFALRAHHDAWPVLAGGGTSLDAVERCARFAEADPEVDSVGFGGLPDARGDVTLDACIMTGPAACGAVCAVERHRHPITIARRVMESTPHVMLAGRGADDFADAHAPSPGPMLSDAARERYERWRARPHVVDQSRDGTTRILPVDPGDGGPLFDAHAMDQHDPPHDTICTLALDDRGVLAGACTTSGMPYKLPGRVGDSPLIGHGLYVDPEAGAAAATGTGELIMGLCSSFLAVECMRRGAAPVDALREALERVLAAHDLGPADQIAMIALRPDGAHASGALRPQYKSVLTTAAGDVVLDPEVVLLDA